MELDNLRATTREHDLQVLGQTIKLVEEAAELSVRVTELETALIQYHESYKGQPDHRCEKLESADRWAQLTLKEK